MVELIIGLAIAGIALYGVIFGSLFFSVGMAYGYWGLSIGMAPVLWILMFIGALIGLIVAIKNAFLALKSIRKGV